MINSLESLFGLELLQELLPAAQQAADILHNAACSQEVCMGLMHGSSCSAVAHTEAATAGEALQSVLQLLQSLLVHVFDAAAVSETDSAAQAPQTAGAAVRLDAVCDPGLQQYVLAVLERLQAAATQHEVGSRPCRKALTFDACSSSAWHGCSALLALAAETVVGVSVRLCTRSSRSNAQILVKAMPRFI